MESHPVQTINVHDYLRPKLCDLYENDCIFDKFEVSISGDSTTGGIKAMTGSYNNYFHIYNTQEPSYETILQADKNAFRALKVPNAFGNTSNGNAVSSIGRVGVPKDGKNGIKKDDINPDTMDYGRKILHSSWHPREDTLAVAATNNLFIFTYY
ncbi:Protein phosphatase PP2A regulatory subunit B [Zancudomyces culisetae]|uniref:Protein phosphatase PP2A regulatory subunit B n=1 Tax=Zancudomyces culisetae TaxID=1213189 RepID=A0A1R1PVX1_ZANCU|nr:Protein phosphatase PP2A regulatory subunit B [Zancudomyces culisetae]|eukprot:OMH85120.1 Protein phosphatase PP2A regulatory subunit B [Zancudomyces culisetae]